MTRLRWVVLGMAVTSSVATSTGPPYPLETMVEGPALLWSDTDLEVEVTFASAPDCEALVAAPWIAGAASFDTEPVQVALTAGVIGALPSPGGDGLADTGSLRSQSCTVALLSTSVGDSVVVLPEGAWVSKSTVEVSSAGDLREGMLAYVPERGTWNDGGLDVVQAVLDPCESVRAPSWTPNAFVGDVTITAVRASGDCTTVTHDQGQLEVCGIAVPVETGDLVRLDVDVDHLDIDVFAGGRSYIGPDVADLDVGFEGVTPDHDRRCTPTSVAGAASGLVRIDDALLRDGEQLELDGGAVLRVLTAYVGADADLRAGAVVSYVQR